MKHFSIHKFGGTSLGSTERIAHAARLVRKFGSRELGSPVSRQSGDEPVSCAVVVSAMSGVTSELSRLLVAKEPGWAIRDFQGLLASHLSYLDEFDVAPGARLEFEALVATANSKFAVWSSKNLEPHDSSRVAIGRDLISLGEILAAHLVVAALRQVGVRALVCDAAEFLDAEGPGDEAVPDSGADARISEVLDGHLKDNIVPVVTGYRARQGSELVLLGRGGSDLTATSLAAARGGSEVTIWTDVCGLRSADPARVPSATLLSKIDYVTAAEMAGRGAGVLHRRAIAPAARTGAALRIRSAQQPEAASTEVGAFGSQRSGPLALTSIGQIMFREELADNSETAWESLSSGGYFRVPRAQNPWRAENTLADEGIHGCALFLVGDELGEDADLRNNWYQFFANREIKPLALGSTPGGASLGVLLTEMPDDAVLTQIHRAFLE